MPALPSSNWILETSKDENSTTSMGNVFHCSTGPLRKFYLGLIWKSQDTVRTAGHSWQQTKSYPDYSENGKDKMSKNKQIFANRLTKKNVQMHFSCYLKLSTNCRISFRISILKSSVGRTEERLWYSDTPSDRIKLHENNHEDIK